MKYLKKVSDNKYLVLAIDELINYIHSRDHPIEIANDLYINDNQRIYFTSKARFMSVVTYYPVDLVNIVLDKYSDYLLNYVYIKHDCDVDDTGVIKKTHIHLLLHLSNSFPLSLCVKLFHTTNVEAVDGTNKLLLKNKILYLTHESKKAIEKHKYKYSYDDLISDDLSYWDYFRTLVIDDDNVAFHIICDTLNCVSRIDMIKRYGQNYVVNYSRYLDFIKSMPSNEIDLLIKGVKK